MVDVAVLTAKDAEEDLERDAQILLSQPHVRSVAVFEPAGVGLDESRAGVRHVAGDPNLEIIYKERGLSFRLDVSKRLSRLSRCQGGRTERERLAKSVVPGERVLVLGSGIGITACVLGAAMAEVLGIERDAVKNDFALANIHSNKLQGSVHSICRDPLDMSKLHGFDRICAFLKFQAIENLKPLMSALRPGGTLHYYNHESQDTFSKEPTEVLESFRSLALEATGFQGKVKMTWRGKVPKKSIAPKYYRVGMDLQIS
eukprot:Skav213840  [mRNA]  locus=scaffold315:229356:230129:+ [translate_table: standard]